MSDKWSDAILRNLGKPIVPSAVSDEASKLHLLYSHTSWPEADLRLLRQSAFDLTLLYPEEFRYWFPCFVAAMLGANEKACPHPDVVDTTVVILASITAISWGSNKGLIQRLAAFSESERLWLAQLLEDGLGRNELFTEEVKLAVETLRSERC